ncbi:class I glutamine amidotransferase-like protein [Syncephalis plumigaleata]|nr:class I glutamine amidotransferase-like protein [Syncephalis plumigaleata]
MVAEQQTLRVAFLVADTPMPEIVAKYGDYPVLYTNMLKRALVERGLESSLQLDIETFDIVNAMVYPEQPETFDAILISGSAATAFDQLPWITRLIEYTRELPQIAPNTRLVGICFGHQIIARAFGGQLERNTQGWEFGWTELKLTKAGASFLKTDKATLSVQQVHKDHVIQLPTGFQELASTDISPNQIMWRPHQIFSIQAHPEFSSSLVKDLLEIRHQRGIIDDETAKRGLSRTSYQDDSNWLSAYILDFMMKRL